MSTTKTELTKKSQATKPKKLNIDVEEEFNNLYISNNKFKRGIRRIAYGVHDKFSKENKWGKRPTVEEIEKINTKIDKIKNDFTALQNLYNGKIEEIEKLEKNQDYQDLLNKSRAEEDDENNTILQEISSRFIYAKNCITDVLDYINKLPQNIIGLLKPANNFAIKAPRNTQWKDTKWKNLYEDQAKLIDQENKMKMARTAGQNCINNGNILTGLTVYAGTQIYESTGTGVQNRTKINETGSKVRKETTEYFETQFGPVLEMKKDFKDLETDKKNQQETYKKLKTTAENDYHILPKKSIMNMTRILYQIWSTVADLIEKIKSNYGKRLDKGFFMSAKKKEEQLKSIEENITNCINLLNRDFESKVQEFEKRIENLKTEVTPISNLSDSATDEIETLTRFCDSVKEKVTKFVEVNKTLGTHIVEASEVVCYVNTGEQPMQGMLLNQKQFPESPEFNLNEL